MNRESALRELVLAAQYGEYHRALQTAKCAECANEPTFGMHCKDSYNVRAFNSYSAMVEDMIAKLTA